MCICGCLFVVFMPSFKDVNRYLEIGFIFPSCIVAGLLVGYWIDKYFGTHFVYVVGLLLGIAAGFVQMIRITMKTPKP